MPGYVPSRPAAGAIIATDWGQETHDRVYLPKGVTASGSAVVVPATTHSLLNLSARSTGNAAWLQPDNQTLKCPVGHSGYYQFEAYVSVGSVAAAVGLQLRILRNGSLLLGNSSAALGSIATGLQASGIFSVQDGDTISLTGWASVAASSWSVTRFTVWRIADNHATT